LDIGILRPFNGLETRARAQTISPFGRGIRGRKSTPQKENPRRIKRTKKYKEPKLKNKSYISSVHQSKWILRIY